MMIFYPICIGLIFISNYQIVDSLWCKNNKGEDVDYWVAYTPPKSSIAKGYYYISSQPEKPIIAKESDTPKPDSSSVKSGIFGSLGNLASSASGLAGSVSSLASSASGIAGSVSGLAGSAINKASSGLANVVGLSSNGFEFSIHSIESKESIVYHTFKKLYEMEDKPQYAMFSNKKPQNTPTSTLDVKKKLIPKFGSSKGVIAWEKAGNGFWVMSSISNFGPFSRGEYKLGETSSSKLSLSKLFSRKSSQSKSDNGHLTMCLSLDAEQIRKVLEHLITIDVLVYDKKIENDDSYLKHAQEQAYSWSHASINRLRTRSNHDFIGLITRKKNTFSIYKKKMNSFGKVFDKLHDKSINFKSHASQSRISGLFSKIKKLAKNTCSKTVNDISEIKISTTSWTSDKDDSNWAVSRTNSLFCFSDIGRNAGFTDAGGMVCLDQPQIHDAFLKSGKTSCKPVQE